MIVTSILFDMRYDMSKLHESDAKIFKALCDEKRLLIIEQLRSGEKCACVLIDDLKIAQSALSYHMKILCESGLIKARQDGKWTHYSLDKLGSDYALNRLSQITRPDKNQEKTCSK